MDLLSSLNPAQRRAVETPSKKVLVVAGAGTGKTTVLARRVAYLVERGCPPELILAVTFTRKAASEMRERIAGLLADRRRPGMPEIKTLHAWGAALIRRYAERVGLTRDFTIYDETDREDVVRMVAGELGHKPTVRMSTLMRDPKVLELYGARLRQGNALDFDQIEALTLKLLQEYPEAQKDWTRRYRHVLVDEFQDTNLAQVAILGGLYPENLYVVGDPRQSIYRFRGAEVKTIVDYARDAEFEVVELTTNYRSLSEIVQAGNRCADAQWTPMDSGRADPGRAGARVEHLRFYREAPCVGGLVREALSAGFKPREIAVLARNWAALDGLRSHLVAGGIPVNYCGEEDDPWTSEDGRALARCLLLANNVNDDNLAALVAEWGALGRRRFADMRELRAAALRRRVPLLGPMQDLSEDWKAVGDLQDRTGLGGSAARHARDFVVGLGVAREYKERGLISRIALIQGLIDEVEARHPTLEDFAEWWAGRSAAERLQTGRDAVAVLTVHASKGLEWPVVILADARAGVFPTERKGASPDELAEDQRVLYVALTRARDWMLASCPDMVVNPWTHAPERARPTPLLPPPWTTWSPGPWGGLLAPAR